MQTVVGDARDTTLLESILRDGAFDSVINCIGVLNPIKCVYASDYHFSDHSFIFTSGDLKISSVVHEYLHTVVHPLLAGTKTERKVYPGIDESYCLDQSEQGYRNAFEEYAVRSLTKRILRQEWPADLSDYLIHLI